MVLWIQILPGSQTPIYLQIAEQITRALVSGHLKTGERLPSVRKLAAEIVVNPNTVAKAYANLERQGVLITKKGSGTFINDPKFRSADAADISLLTERMEAVIARGLSLKIAPEDLIKIFKDKVRLFENNTIDEEIK